LWERGVVFYDEALQNDRDTQAGMEQLLSFEKGSHVDFINHDLTPTENGHADTRTNIQKNVQDTKDFFDNIANSSQQHDAGNAQNTESTKAAATTAAVLTEQQASDLIAAMEAGAEDAP
jgi:hypothetical protein